MKNSFLTLMILLCSTAAHAQLKMGETVPEIELMSAKADERRKY